jgi:deazaflavin-dependent oxidoreductase (nitroreductase family)
LGPVGPITRGDDDHGDNTTGTRGPPTGLAAGAHAPLPRERRSGRPHLGGRHHADGERYVVVASRGGAPKHPDWYENLVAHPEVYVQVMAERFKARARSATSAEKPALWRTMTAIWPPYDEYQQRTTREIPVVILERA